MSSSTHQPPNRPPLPHRGCFTIANHLWEGSAPGPTARRELTHISCLGVGMHSGRGAPLSETRTVLFQGKRAHRNTLLWEDDAGQQRVSGAGRPGPPRPRHSLSDTPSGPGAASEWLPATAPKKGNLGSDAMGLSIPVFPPPHTSSLKTLPLPPHTPSLSGNE